MTSELIFRACWQSSLLAVVVWAMSRRFPKMSKPILAALWWLVSLRALAGLIPIPTIGVPILDEAPVSNAVISTIPETVTHLAHSTRNAVQPSLSAPINPIDILLFGWALGSIAVALFYIRQVIALRRTIAGSTLVEDVHVAEALLRMAERIGVRRLPEIRQSERIVSPMVAGLWRPKILLPAALPQSISREDLDILLAHELAHIRRGDILQSCVPILANIAFFFLPTTWLAAREWETMRESICDSMAIDAVKTSPSRYRQFLVRMVSWEPQVAASMAIGAASPLHTLEKRLKMIHQSTINPRRIRPILAGIAGAMILSSLPLEAVAKPQQPPKKSVNATAFEQTQKNSGKKVFSIRVRTLKLIPGQVIHLEGAKEPILDSSGTMMKADKAMIDKWADQAVKSKVATDLSHPWFLVSYELKSEIFLGGFRNKGVSVRVRVDDAGDQFSFYGLVAPGEVKPGDRKNPFWTGKLKGPLKVSENEAFILTSNAESGKGKYVTIFTAVR